MLENALRFLSRRSKMQRRYAPAVENHHLARFHVADVLGVNQVESAGLRRQDVSAIQLSQAQRTEPPRVANAVNRVLEKHDQGISSHHLVERFGNGFGNARLSRAGEIVQDHFRVAGSLENIAASFQFLAHGRGIHQVAVVRKRNLALVAAHFQRLGVSQVRIASSGVTRVADGMPSRQALNDVLREDLLHMPHALLADQIVAVRRGDASAFLAAML